MAHVKGSGSVNQHSQGKRHGKRLGLKLFGGQLAKTGMVIVRQRGMRYKASVGVGVGRDYTLFAKQEGKVVFSKKKGKSIVAVV